MDRIIFGKLVNTHGLKGEVKIISDSDFKKERFKVGNQFYVGKLLVTVNSYRVHKNFDLITLKGFDNINDVEKFKGMDVSVEKSVLSDLEADEFYFHELEGMEVFHDAALVGTVVEVRDTPGNTLLIIKSGKKRILIPYVDQFVKEVDSENKKIYITPIEGLLWE